MALIMSTPLSTARRNVAWRIEQVLRTQHALPEPTLTNWQADMVMAAIEALDEERFADGENAMMKAERPDLWEPTEHIPADPWDLATMSALLKKAFAT